MGAQGQQATGPRVPSHSQQPSTLPCAASRQHGGQAGTSVPCQHLRLPPPGSPLSPLTSLATGCGARQMAPICWGARARAFIPSTPAGRARPAMPSVCAVPPDGEAGISPGSAALPAPSQIFISRVLKRLMGYTVFGLCHSQSRAPAGRWAGESPCTRINMYKPSSRSTYLSAPSPGGRG